MECADTVQLWKAGSRENNGELRELNPPPLGQEAPIQTSRPLALTDLTYNYLKDTGNTAQISSKYSYSNALAYFLGHSAFDQSQKDKLPLNQSARGTKLPPQTIRRMERSL